LTADGVSDVDALVRAHVAGLSNTSFTVKHQRTVNDVAGTRIVQQRTRAEIGPEYRTFTAVRTITGESVTDRVIRTSSDGRRTVQRVTDDGANSSGVVAGERGVATPPREGPFFDPTYRERIRALFAGANVTAVTPADEEIGQVPGTRVYRIHADGATDRSQFPVSPTSRVADVWLTATVSPDGVIRSYTVHYTVVRNGTTLRVTESLRYTSLGTTSVATDGSDPE
jgi:hypothetical protein